MATIKGKGFPTRQTQGGIGDIYVDITTGRQYKCTNAYKASTAADGKGDYTWTPTKNAPAAAVKEAPKAEEPKKAPKPAKAKVEEVVEEAKPETTEATEEPTATEHVDYTKYSKKTK